MARYAIDEAVARDRANPGKPGMRRLDVEPPYASAKCDLLGAVGHANDVRVVLDGSGNATMFGFETDLETVVLLFSSLLVQATQSMLRVPRGEIGPQVRAFRHAFLVGLCRPHRQAPARSAYDHRGRGNDERLSVGSTV